MSRVKRGVTARARHKKILEQSKGYRGFRRNVIRMAKQAVTRAGQYAYRDRKVRKREFRALWIQRINAGARMFGMSYSRMIDGLNKAGIIIDRKVLADLAVADLPAFGQLCEKAKAALGGAPAAAAPAPHASAASQFVATAASAGGSVDAALAKAAGFKVASAEDIVIIEGIGPKIAELLKQAGHGTFAAIAAMSPAAIKEILAAGGSSFNRANPESWPEQAALAAANRWAELKALQDRLNAGVA
jgi:large subunit ribosomal protein L20